MLTNRYGEDATAECLRWLVEYEDWHRNEMVLPGGIEAQPSKWVQRCRLIDGEYSKQRVKEAAARKKDSERKAKRNYG